MSTAYDPMDRRPIASRERGVFRRLAAALVARGVTPNAISIGGMISGLIAGAALVATAHVDGFPYRLLFVLAGVCIQLRLLANMLDGMVAVQTGTASPVGELYNEVPDRVSDTAVLVGLGYAVGATPVLGWAAAVAAMLTAYVRATGKGAGAKSEFCGPMAKPHRMALVTAVCAFAAVVPLRWVTAPVAGATLLDWTLWVVIGGSLITAVRRLLRIGAALRARTG